MRYVSKEERNQEQKKIRNNILAKGFREIIYNYGKRFETQDEKNQREELAKTAFNDAQLKFNNRTQKWQLRDAKSTAEEMIRREAIAKATEEADKIKFSKNIVRDWLVSQKKNNPGCQYVFADKKSNKMPDKLKEVLESLKITYPDIDVEKELKENLKGRAKHSLDLLEVDYCKALFKIE